MIGKADGWLATVIHVSFAIVLALTACLATAASTGTYDVTEYGAVGDGRALDTAAINKTIETAAAEGGGTVYFPPGKYLSYSIHLRSNVALYLSQGTVILAAAPTEEAG